MELVMPEEYTNVSDSDIIEYSGEFGGTILLALFTVANFAITNPEFFSTAWDFFDNSTSMLTYLRNQYFSNGKYKMFAEWIPGSSGSIYPPNSWQGASGYYKYVYRRV